MHKNHLNPLKSPSTYSKKEYKKGTLNVSADPVYFIVTDIVEKFSAKFIGALRSLKWRVTRTPIHLKFLKNYPPPLPQRPKWFTQVKDPKRGYNFTELFWIGLNREVSVEKKVPTLAHMSSIKADRVVGDTL